MFVLRRHWHNYVSKIIQINQIFFTAFAFFSFSSFLSLNIPVISWVCQALCTFLIGCHISFRQKHRSGTDSGNNFYGVVSFDTTSPRLFCKTPANSPCYRQFPTLTTKSWFDETSSAFKPTSSCPETVFT